MRLKTIAQKLGQAEEERVVVGGGSNPEVETVKQGYEAIIDELSSILEQPQIKTEEEKLAIGQTIFTIATIYTSLAHHGTNKDQEKTDYLKQARELMDGELMKTCQPAMERTNHSVHNTPLIWSAEINRVKARIEERKPNATRQDLDRAVELYEAAVKEANQVFYESVTSQTNLWTGALSAWSTALGEKARLLPIEKQNEALTDMANIIGVTYSLYANGSHKDLDRTSAVIGRTIQYCAENKIPENNPTYQQSLMLFLLVAPDMDKKTLSNMLEKAQKDNLTLPTNFISALQAIIDKN